MSTAFTNSDLLARARPDTTPRDHQEYSWMALLHKWLASSERMHQRADLGAIADNPHLLADLGLTREEALGQANKPFWR